MPGTQKYVAICRWIRFEALSANSKQGDGLGDRY